MSAESTTVFRVFRVLWFPMSLNAVALGALALVLFYGGTWVSASLLANRELADEASHAFVPAAVSFLKHGDWPGFPVGRRADGTSDHEDLVSEAASAEAKAEAQVEKSRTATLFPGFEPALDQRAARETDATKRRQVMDGLIHGLGRYRVVFSVQVVLFLFLLATFGVAICRIVALRIARDEYCTLGSALSYAWKVKTTGLLLVPAVAFPAIGIGVLITLAGLFGQIPWVGWLFMAMGFPLLIILALLVVLILTGGFLSLGLAPAAIAVERRGTYDSLGKAFNYIFARPLPLILHLTVVVTFVGLLDILLLEHRLMERVLSACLTPVFDWKDFSRIAAGDTAGQSGFAWFCAWLYKLSLHGYRILVYGAVISYVFGAFTSLFLIMRQDVDGIDPADVAKDGPAS